MMSGSTLLGLAKVLVAATSAVSSAAAAVAFAHDEVAAAAKARRAVDVSVPLAELGRGAGALDGVSRGLGVVGEQVAGVGAAPSMTEVVVALDGAGSTVARYYQSTARITAGLEPAAARALQILSVHGDDPATVHAVSLAMDKVGTAQEQLGSIPPEFAAAQTEIASLVSDGEPGGAHLGAPSPGPAGFAGDAAAKSDFAAAVPPGAAASAGQRPEACRIGTAKSIACPSVGWPNNGYHDPQVFFVDHTSGPWPAAVADAVRDWHRTVGIDTYYRRHKCPDLPGIHCVHVYSANYGIPWRGATEPWYAGDNIARMTIFLNDNWLINGRTRSTACHEIGHALGVHHSTTTDSCMWAPTKKKPWKSPHPHADDRAVLTEIYSTVRE